MIFGKKSLVRKDIFTVDDFLASDIVDFSPVDKIIYVDINGEKVPANGDDIVREARIEKGLIEVVIA